MRGHLLPNQLLIIDTAKPRCPQHLLPERLLGPLATMNHGVEGPNQSGSRVSVTLLATWRRPGRMPLTLAIVTNTNYHIPA